VLVREGITLASRQHRLLYYTHGPRVWQSAQIEDQDPHTARETQDRRQLSDNAANMFTHRHTHYRPLLPFNPIGMFKLLILGVAGTTKTTKRTVNCTCMVTGTQVASSGCAITDLKVVE
jgi:hypothetical protein